VRGSGLLLATQLVADKPSQRMIPLPLIVTEEEIDLIVDRLAATPRDYESELQAAGILDSTTG